MLSIWELEGQYTGLALRAVGKGPSLAFLSPDHVREGPVVAINHAILVLEMLTLPNDVYSLQKDYAPVPGCSSPILAHKLESNLKDPYFGDYLFDNEKDFNLPWYYPSVVVCLKLATLFGCVEVEYLCCDSAFGDLRVYEGGEVREDQRALQYKDHPGLVESHKGSMPVTFTKVVEYVAG